MTLKAFPCWCVSRGGVNALSETEKGHRGAENSIIDYIEGKRRTCKPFLWKFPQKVTVFSKKFSHHLEVSQLTFKSSSAGEISTNSLQLFRAPLMTALFNNKGVAGMKISSFLSFRQEGRRQRRKIVPFSKSRAFWSQKICLKVNKVVSFLRCANKELCWARNYMKMARFEEFCSIFDRRMQESSVKLILMAVLSFFVFILIILCSF